MSIETHTALRGFRGLSRGLPIRQRCRPAAMIGRAGMTSIEFAIVAPLLFLFVFGMIEFGRMVMVKQAVTNAAREGCRVACLATTTNAEDVSTRVHEYIDSVIPNGDAVRITGPASLAAVSSGTELTVTVEVDFDDVGWFPAEYFGFNPTIAAVARQHRE